MNDGITYLMKKNKIDVKTGIGTFESTTNTIKVTAEGRPELNNRLLVKTSIIATDLKTYHFALKEL